MANTLRLDQDYPCIAKSEEWYERASGLIPGGTQTLAKGTSQNSKGVMPIFVSKAKGSHVWDVDGNEYLDMSMAIGPVSLGYAYDSVDRAIVSQLQDGITFSLPHHLEVEVAELIRDTVPNAEMVRFSKTGADVTSAAIRVACAVTGRTTVLCCGYHGWHDWYIATTDRHAGIPDSAVQQTFTFQYNDIESLEQALDDTVAAVILEPITFTEPRDFFLQKVRDLCTQNGTLLIFDEMWTGFRLALGGAQQYFGVDADLICFSKAIANGMPLSVLCGKREFMHVLADDVFFYTTFGGEALSLAAARATIHELREQPVTLALDARGRMLKDGLNGMLVQMQMPYIHCIGLPCRTMLSFDSADALIQKTFVQQELIRRGILWNGFHTMSYSHSLEDIDFVLAAYHDVFTLLRQAIGGGSLGSKLRGLPMQAVFRKTTNFNSKPRPT